MDKSDTFIPRSSSRQRFQSSREFRKGTSSNLTPFSLSWSFGRTRNVNVVNLTRRDRKVIFYASAHVGVAYNYVQNTMKFVQGHRNAIRSITTDDEGRWLVTADSGYDSTFIVWDTDNWLPIHSVFNLYPGKGVRVIGMSGDAKYIATVSGGKEQVVAMWNWTLGKNEPEYMKILPPNIGQVMNITFSRDVSEHFMLTTYTHAVFCTWKCNEITLHIRENVKKIGRFSDSTYATGSHQAITTTVSGHALIWSSYPYSDSFDINIPFSNKKYIIKCVRLESRSILIVRSLESTIVTSNAIGQIRFYDIRMKILYWTNFDHGPLLDVSFHKIPNQCELLFCQCSEEAVTRNLLEKAKSVVSVHSRCKKDDVVDVEHEYRHEENDKLCDHLSTDASYESRPFPVRELIVTARDGQIVLMNLVESKCYDILKKYQYKITAIDTHREKPYICIGNSHGHVTTYNYSTKQRLIRNRLDPNEAVGISCLKYSCSCFFLLCGMRNGTLLMLHPLDLTIMKHFPEQNGTSPLQSVTFSGDDAFFSVRDASMCVSLFKIPTQNGVDIEFWGRTCAHYKPIRSVIFTPTHLEANDWRLFSLGEDRLLVEYDLDASGPNNFVVKSSDRIEQSAVPLRMIDYPRFTPEGFILVANSEYKFKLYNDLTKLCRKTTLGPLYGSPVNYMKIISVSTVEYRTMYMIYANERHIGLLLFPLDGNPYKSLGIVGHPIQITHVSLSADKQHLFTVGLNDYNVLMWRINTQSVDVMARVGGLGLDPYYCLIEGGQRGALVKEIQDLFYLVQIRTQGELNRKEITITNKIPLCELTDLIRAAGYYPTEQEVENMIHEVRFSKYAQTGKEANDIEFDDFMILYLNHRPALGISLDDLKKAFDTFTEKTDPRGRIIQEGEPAIPRKDFLIMLQNVGECYSIEQVQRYFKSLLVKDEIVEEGYQASEAEFEELHRDSTNYIPRRIEFDDFLHYVLGLPRAFLHKGERETDDERKSHEET